MGTPILSKPVNMSYRGVEYSIVIEGTKEETCITTAYAILIRWHDKGYKSGHPFTCRQYRRRKVRVWIRRELEHQERQTALFPMVSQ